MKTKGVVLLLAYHLIVPPFLTFAVGDMGSLSSGSSSLASNHPDNKQDAMLTPSMGRDLLEYLMESASHARGQLPPGFLLPSATQMSTGEDNQIERSLLNHTSIEPPPLNVQQINSQLNEQLKSAGLGLIATTSNSGIGSTTASNGAVGSGQINPTNSPLSLLGQPTTPFNSLLNKQTKANEPNSFASLANFYHKTLKPPTMDGYRKTPLFAARSPIRLSNEPRPNPRPLRPYYTSPMGSPSPAASSSPIATLEKPSDLMKSADFASSASEGLEEEPMMPASHGNPSMSAAAAAAAASGVGANPHPYFMREYRTFPSLSSFGASSAYAPSYLAAAAAAEAEGRHHPSYYQGHSASGAGGYYTDHHHEGLSSYGKSDFYWLIPVAFIIGAGALLLPIISVLMTTMVTSGTLTLSTGKRRKRHATSFTDLDHWQQIMGSPMVDKLQTWWKQFNLALDKFEK